MNQNLPSESIPDPVREDAIETMAEFSDGAYEADDLRLSLERLKWASEQVGTDTEDEDVQ